MKRIQFLVLGMVLPLFMNIGFAGTPKLVVIQKYKFDLKLSTTFKAAVFLGLDTVFGNAILMVENVPQINVKLNGYEGGSVLMPPRQLTSNNTIPLCKKVVYGVHQNSTTGFNQINPFNMTMKNTAQETAPFFKNRRNVYSTLWVFASLNYLYADLAGLMDANVLLQYQSGVVDGTKITPEFLTVAAVYMQIPIANVFLPQIIKKESTLRWVQIISGTFMTLAQTATLFIGKPTPYYVLFSAFEVAATTYIAVDAICWKTKPKKVK